MTTSTFTARFASFSAACAVTLAVLMGVSSMASDTPAQVWMAKAAAVKAA
ncbi:hypothetical protein [Ideonella sp. BN130291]|nr:hypothetical protein [Ideonella sp. BN130291]